ncbi:hypothetical protein LCGC14_0754190 [marine sediment metagenome]|uniref:Tyr recombinase domain-containing protein n=1 Tax=marine sediment metagenome TaxID=412755 RepID=A0A0F9Q7B4_9ZZZZ
MPRRISAEAAMSLCQMKVLKPSRRKHYIMRWVEPVSGKPREETTRAKHKRQAYQVAADRARAVADGTYREEYGWIEFCMRYQREHLSSLSGKSREAWKTTRRWIGRIEQPATINEVDAAFVVRWQNGLRRHGVGETSIAAYSARLRAALRWAADLEIIATAPKVRLPHKAKGKSKLARSREVRTEEFERMLMAAEKVRPTDSHRWQRFLRGLWHSGFRLDELRRLSWDAGAQWSIDASGLVPLVRILGDAEKAGTDREQPITPEFWDLCCEVPEESRHGYVFPLPGRSGRQMTVKRIGRIISSIGRRAGVITDATSGKCATSQDVGRRAFTTRMSGRLSLADLQKWMRHASVQTTLDYYHHADAEQLSAKVWGKE